LLLLLLLRCWLLQLSPCTSLLAFVRVAVRSAVRVALFHSTISTPRALRRPPMPAWPLLSWLTLSSAASICRFRSSRLHSGSQFAARRAAVASAKSCAPWHLRGRRRHSCMELPVGRGVCLTQTCSQCLGFCKRLAHRRTSPCPRGPLKAITWRWWQAAWQGWRHAAWWGWWHAA